MDNEIQTLFTGYLHTLNSMETLACAAGPDNLKVCGITAELSGGHNLSEQLPVQGDVTLERKDLHWHTLSQQDHATNYQNITPL